MRYNPILDWELACQWWGSYTREQFALLDVDSQARIIAVYRVAKQIESVLAKAQADDMKRGS